MQTPAIEQTLPAGAAAEPAKSKQAKPPPPTELQIDKILKTLTPEQKKRLSIPLSKQRIRQILDLHGTDSAVIRFANQLNIPMGIGNIVRCFRSVIVDPATDTMVWARVSHDDIARCMDIFRLSSAVADQRAQYHAYLAEHGMVVAYDTVALTGSVTTVPKSYLRDITPYYTSFALDVYEALKLLGYAVISFRTLVMGIYIRTLPYVVRPTAGDAYVSEDGLVMRWSWRRPPDQNNPPATYIFCEHMPRVMPLSMPLSTGNYCESAESVLLQSTGQESGLARLTSPFARMALTYARLRRQLQHESQLVDNVLRPRYFVQRPPVPGSAIARLDRGIVGGYQYSQENFMRSEQADASLATHALAPTATSSSSTGSSANVRPIYKEGRISAWEYGVPPGFEYFRLQEPHTAVNADRLQGDLITEVSMIIGYPTFSDIRKTGASSLPTVDPDKRGRTQPTAKATDNRQRYVSNDIDMRTFNRRMTRVTGVVEDILSQTWLIAYYDITAIETVAIAMSLTQQPATVANQTTMMRKLSRYLIPRIYYCVPPMIDGHMHDSLQRLGLLCHCTMDTATMFAVGIDEGAINRSRITHQIKYGDKQCPVHEIERNECATDDANVKKDNESGDDDETDVDTQPAAAVTKKKRSKKRDRDDDSPEESRSEPSTRSPIPKRRKRNVPEKQ